ncbi:MAG: N-acetylmuramidase family protein [Salinisphaera sp.]|nr:N-acetylmuramidase family protein [Salinisphaera sp.]
MLLKTGRTGAEVEALQHQLATLGYDVAVDGVYGSGTARAVTAFQRDAGLLPDGIAGKNTLAALGADVDPKSLTDDDIAQAATGLGVDAASVRALLRVESRGEGFLRNGAPIILFERHIMWRELEGRGIDPEPWSEKYPDLVNQVPGGYQGGQKEIERLNRARNINSSAAISSASWGLFQVMGMHWDYLDYASPQHYEAAMYVDSAHQLDAFCRYIKADPTLHQGLEHHDWHTVARLYNGPAYEKNQYAARLERAYDNFTQAAAAGV